MSIKDADAVLVSMLERKVTRLGSLQKDLQTLYAETAQLHDTPRRLAELRDLLSDVCQLTIAIFAMRRMEASGTDSGNSAIGSNEIDAILRTSSDHSDSDGHEWLISDAVEFARSKAAADFDPSNMQRGLGKLQEEVAELKDVTDAARPGGLLSIVLRVGLVTLAAAGVAAPVTALVLNDPISRKALEAALTTFIATATVEAATASLESFGMGTSVDRGGSSQYEDRASSPPRLNTGDQPIEDTRYQIDPGEPGYYNKSPGI